MIFVFKQIARATCNVAHVMFFALCPLPSALCYDFLMRSFSVIIPCHNAAGTIKQCIEALLGSDYPRDRFEIIVSDDGSIDASLEIARSLGVRVLPPARSTGPGGARNRGAQAASYGRLLFFDSDVIVRPDTLQLFDHALERFPEATVIQAIYAAGPYRTLLSLYQHLWFYYFYTLRRNYPTLTFSSSCFAISRKDFIEAGMLNPRLRTNEDTEFGYRLARMGKQAMICTDIEVYHDRIFSLKGFLKRNFFVHNFVLVRLTYGISDIRSGNPEYDVPIKNLLLTAALVAAILLWAASGLWGFGAAAAGVFLWQSLLNLPFLKFAAGRAGRGKVALLYGILLLDNAVKLAGIVRGLFDFFIRKKHRLITEYAETVISK